VTDPNPDVVPERSLLPEHRTCPICGADQPTRDSVVLQDDPFVALRTCGRCFGASATRFPTNDFLSALYDPSHYASDLLSQHDVTASFGTHVASFVDAPSDADLSFVDYGGNDGGLSKAIGDALRARGHTGRLRFVVVDLEKRPDQDGLEFATVEEFMTSDARHDVVLASAVLEHLVDLPTVAPALLRACGSGGLLYARAPWERSLHRWVPGYRIRWPRHLHDLGPRFWQRFLTTFGYRGSLLRSAPSPVESSFAAKPVRTLAAHVLKAPANVERAIRGGAVGRHAPWWRFVGGWEAVYRVDGPVDAQER